MAAPNLNAASLLSLCRSASSACRLLMEQPDLVRLLDAALGDQPTDPRRRWGRCGR